MYLIVSKAETAGTVIRRTRRIRPTEHSEANTKLWEPAVHLRCTLLKQLKNWTLLGCLALVKSDFLLQSRVGVVRSFLKVIWEKKSTLASRTSNGSTKQHFDDFSVNESETYGLHFLHMHRGLKIKEGKEGLQATCIWSFTKPESIWKVKRVVGPQLSWVCLSWTVRHFISFKKMLEN